MQISTASFGRSSNIIFFFGILFYEIGVSLDWGLSTNTHSSYICSVVFSSIGEDAVIKFYLLSATEF